jgi:hypothetical protein
MNQEGTSQQLCADLNYTYPIGTKLPCPLCFMRINTSLEEHLQLEHGEYDCAFCGKLFDSDSLLSQHMLTIHPTEYTTTEFVNDDLSNNNLTCPICNIVIIEGKSPLNGILPKVFVNLCNF